MNKLFCAKNIYLLVIILIFTSGSSLYSFFEQKKQAYYSYILRLVFPPTLQATEGLSCNYKGMPLSLSNKWCVIPETQETLTFSLIITNEVEFRNSGNTVRYLKRVPSTPFAWYDLTLTKVPFNPEKPWQKLYHWKIEEKPEAEAPLRIPEHAIIIFMDPDFVETIVEQDFGIEDFGDEEELGDSQKEFNGQPNSIELPVIIIKKNISPEKLEENLVYTQMAALDLKTISNLDTAIIKKIDEPIIMSKASLKR